MYDSHKIWSKTEKKYKTVRRLIGKIDKESGKVVPTGPRGRPKRESREPNLKSNTPKTPTTAVPVETAASDVQALSTTIAELKIENSLLINEREKITGLLDGIMHFAQQARELLDQTDGEKSD